VQCIWSIDDDQLFRQVHVMGTNRNQSEAEKELNHAIQPVLPTSANRTGVNSFTHHYSTIWKTRRSLRPSFPFISEVSVMASLYHSPCQTLVVFCQMILWSFDPSLVNNVGYHYISVISPFGLTKRIIHCKTQPIVQ